MVCSTSCSLIRVHYQVSCCEKVLVVVVVVVVVVTWQSEQSALLLLASSAGNGIGDALASIAESVLGRLHHALALAGGVVAAGASGVTELLAGRLLALCCRC